MGSNLNLPFFLQTMQWYIVSIYNSCLDVLKYCTVVCQSVTMQSIAIPFDIPKNFVWWWHPSNFNSKNIHYRIRNYVSCYNCLAEVTLFTQKQETREICTQIILLLLTSIQRRKWKHPLLSFLSSRFHNIMKLPPTQLLWLLHCTLHIMYGYTLIIHDITLLLTTTHNS
jgi:hypothetical protein